MAVFTAVFFAAGFLALLDLAGAALAAIALTVVALAPVVFLRATAGLLPPLAEIHSNAFASVTSSGFHSLAKWALIF